MGNQLRRDWEIQMDAPFSLLQISNSVWSLHIVPCTLDSGNAGGSMFLVGF